ncbi:MAG: EAL domain-containing protein [Betaproteobacteria bacterium]|nr:EAL domain-containing protein [Betaproteobacteria bacterium]
MPAPRLSIVSKLALLVLGAAVPLAAILAWSLDALFRSEAAAAGQHAASIANSIAARAGMTVDRTRAMLEAVAKRPLVQAIDRSRCDPLVTEVGQLLPGYANINTFNLQWEFVCSADLPPGAVVKTAFPELYERMVAADDMVLSAPVRGQIKGIWVVIAAHPVKDAANRLVGAVTAPIDLSMLGPAVAGAILPAGGTTGIIDRNGYLVVSYPDSAGTGTRAEGAAAVAITSAAPPTIEVGPDGVERIYAGVPVKDSGWIAFAGIPTAAAFAGFQRHRDWILAALILALGMAGLLAFVVARRISRPVLTLRRDAEILASGRLSHRSQVATLDEVGQLVVAFNGMAQALEAHDAERKEAAQKLGESERRFADMLGNVEMISLMLDTDAVVTYCNDYLLRLTGWGRDEVIGRNWYESFVAPGTPDWKAAFAALLANRPEALHRENEILTRSGERRRIRWSSTVLRSWAGEVTGAASIGEDITERSRAEAGLKQLNRVHAVLSHTNALIVRVRDRDELFREACRIAVDQGGFRMAVIGIVDTGTKRLVPAASAGMVGDLLRDLAARFSPAEGANKTVAARAIAEKRAVVSNDSRSDPQVLAGAQYAEAGVRSMAILPLLVADEAVGVLALYAAEIEFFHDEEMELLTGLSRDIAFAIDHLDKQERLDYLAYYDVLTGLANRSLFLERVAQYMRSAAAAGHGLALFVVDLARFRNINDSLGQAAGDDMLRQVAQWLMKDAGDASLLARIEADRFAVVLPVVNPTGNLSRLIERTLTAFQDYPFRLDDAVFRIAAKVGAALFPDDGADAETLFRNAEAALKQAKASGEPFLFYAHQMTDSVAGRLTLENQLRQALRAGEFVLHYQPRVSLATRELTGAEALLRWNDPRAGLTLPGRFIAILEETGLIHDVGRWVLQQAIADHLRWRALGLPAVRVAVNVSAYRLRRRTFIAEIAEAIGVDAQAAAGLELEISESAIMEDVRHSITTLQAIRTLGVRIVIDDFGTGFSSLSYLSRLPVDALKIHESFVSGLTSGPDGLALMSTLINLGRSLKIAVVAEGVETEEQARLLRLLKCDDMQGFLVSRALPAADFEARFLSSPAGGQEPAAPDAVAGPGERVC